MIDHLHTSVLCSQPRSIWRGRTGFRFASRSASRLTETIKGRAGQETRQFPYLLIRWDQYPNCTGQHLPSFLLC